MLQCYTMLHCFTMLQCHQIILEYEWIPIKETHMENVYSAVQYLVVSLFTTHYSLLTTHSLSLSLFLSLSPSLSAPSYPLPSLSHSLFQFLPPRSLFFPLSCRGDQFSLYSLSQRLLFQCRVKLPVLSVCLSASLPQQPHPTLPLVAIQQNRSRF